MLPMVSLHSLGIEPGRTTRQYMHIGEQDVLIELIDRVQPKAMIEIGVNIGLTARAVLNAVTSIEQYVGIDVGPDYRFQIPAQSIERPAEPGRLVRDDPRFELVIKGRDKIQLRHPCGVVFIDGDHGKEAVQSDTRFAASVIAPGGLIIWHDYHNPTVQVTPVLDELHERGREIVSINGTWLAFERQ